MKHVIIGVGAAGIAAARTIRQMESDAEIVMISEDKHVHSRCMLHKYISGERDEVTISFVPENFFEKNRVKWLRGIKVTGVDVGKKEVLTADGAVSYDKLLIAAGAESSRMPIAAFDTAKNVCGLRSLDDAKRIKEAAKNVEHIAIIGAGLVGMDAAYALLELGKKVTVIEIGTRILPLNLDEKAEEDYHARFETAGCNFSFGHKVSNAVVDSAGNITGLKMDDGSVIHCDFVVVAAGARPAVGFLKDSGILVDGVVEVHRNMSTGTRDVYAAGDIVANLSGIWANAVEHGRIAARNMCDDPAIYTHFFATKNTINFFGLITLTLGEVVSKPGDTVHTCHDSRGYRKIVFRDGTVVGVIIQGDISGAGFWQHLVRYGISIDDVQKPLRKVSFADFCGLDEKGEYFYLSRG